MTAYETVTVTRQAQVAVITLNRPERRNAMDQTMNRELLQAVEQAAADTGVRAVVLTGAGQGFCAGADLTLFQPIPEPDLVYELLVGNYQPLITTIAQMDKPVIAAVNGVAAGAGASLALACDLRVMAHDAGLLMAFSNIGLVPDAGATWLLARAIGYGRAYEIAVDGQLVPAERCLELGLANKVVPAAQLMEITMAWALRLAQRPTLALGLTKRALHHALLNDLAATIEFEARLQKQAIASHDFKEGVTAFLEKRPPQFSGS